MANFPSIEINNMQESTQKAVIKSEYNGGYEIQRPRYTRTRKQFTLGFNKLTETEKLTLESFMMDNQGLAFNFTHPTTSTVYSVRNTSDKVDFTFVHPFYYSATIAIKEV